MPGQQPVGHLVPLRDCQIDPADVGVVGVAEEVGEAADQQLRVGDAGGLLAAEAIDGLLYSPKLRTRQTAARILDRLDDVPAEQESSLLPPSSYRRIAEVAGAAEEKGMQRLVLVSHLPLVAELVGWFENGDPGDYRLPGFPSGGIVTIDMEFVDRGMGRLAWYAFPPDYQRLSP